MLPTTSHRWVLLGFLAAAVWMQASAQPLPSDPSERQRALLDRLVTIEVTANRNDNGLPETAYGNGTIISPSGMVITAKHVLEAFPPDEFQPPTYRVVRRIKDGRLEFELAANAMQKSNQFDAAIIPIKGEGGFEFPYLCVAQDHSPLAIGTQLEMRSYVYYDKIGGQPVNEWRLKERPRQPLLNGRQGYADFARYWGADTEFADSESGAAVLHQGELVGIVAKSLVFQQGNVAVPVEGHQYFVPIGLVAGELTLDSLGGNCRNQTLDRAVMEAEIEDLERVVQRINVSLGQKNQLIDALDNYLQTPSPATWERVQWAAKRDLHQIEAGLDSASEFMARYDIDGSENLISNVRSTLDKAQESSVSLQPLENISSHWGGRTSVIQRIELSELPSPAEANDYRIQMESYKRSILQELGALIDAYKGWYSENTR